MPLAPYGTILTVRPEILDPKLLLDMVDLGLVSGNRKKGLAEKAPGLDTVRDPAAFFAITYPTVEVVETLKTLAARVAAPESVPGTLLLSGRYGQGKSHALLAAHHALNAPDVAPEWARRWNLGALELPANPLVVTRAFMQHADEPLWETLLAALSPGKKVKLVGDFPDGALLESLLGDRPVFVILDEVEGWFDAQDERSRSRSRNFLQALTEVSMRTGRLTILTSVLGEKPEPGETIRRVRPLELSFLSADDRLRVVLFRLFSDRDAPSAHAAAADTADAHLAALRAASVRGLDGLRERMLASWPFTPEFLDILLKKVPALGGLQNTRGTLRFLCHVVKHTHQQRPLVSSQDLPFRVSEVQQALTHLDQGSGGEVVRRALGDNYDATPKDLPHRDALFSTLVLYSIADPIHPGATLDELLLATLDPGENPLEIRDSLARLKQFAFNLHDRDERHVFLAVENPHARINAMAGSQLVTGAAARDHVRHALDQVWGSGHRTAVHLADEFEATARRLRELRKERPRLLLSTVALSPKARLRLQNLDDDRNLVLLVEPKVHTSSSDAAYNLLSDEGLLRLGRRLEACRLLLEGRPAPAAAAVYREVLEAETTRLRKEVTDKYGVAVAWHQAGATGAEVDDGWYDLCRLDTPTAEGLLTMWRADLTGLPEVRHEVQKQWPQFRARSVAELTTHFDRTPGLPVPLEAGWVPQAVRQLVQAGVFSLVGADGATLAPNRAAVLTDEALAPYTLTDPQLLDDPTTEDEPIVHPRVSAHYDPTGRCVRLSWDYPPAPSDGSWVTLVQRYTTSRGWEVGGAYPIDTGDTHGANRYLGSDEGAVDSDQLQPGNPYFYYVFLARSDGRGGYTLSQRCDVLVPKVTSTDPDVIETGVHGDLNKLVTELEKLVMSGKMSSEARARKVILRLHSVGDEAVKTHLSGKLAERAGPGLEASADLTLTSRGSWSRQEVLALVRLAPRFAGASYQASVHLKSDTSTTTSSGR
jgi:hypothetical protein